MNKFPVSLCVAKLLGCLPLFLQSCRQAIQEIILLGPVVLQQVVLQWPFHTGSTRWQPAMFRLHLISSMPQKFGTKLSSFPKNKKVGWSLEKLWGVKLLKGTFMAQLSKCLVCIFSLSSSLLVELMIISLPLFWYIKCCSYYKSNKTGCSVLGWLTVKLAIG